MNMQLSKLGGVICIHLYINTYYNSVVHTVHTDVGGKEFVPQKYLTFKVE